MKQKLLIFFISLLILLIPLFLWGNLYFVGGDDSKLYYLFPFEYFKNFTLSLVSDNQLGTLGNYFSQTYLSPFVLLILFLKNIFYFLNIQFFMFGLNLSLGFFFFYLLLGIWIKNKNWFDFWTKVIAGLTYIFSTFTAYTVWTSQLFGLYLISIFPLSLYLFILGVQENKLVFIVLDAILLAVMSATLFSVPWIIALVLASIPLLIYIFWQAKKRFIFFSVFFVLLIVLLNFHWLFHFFYAPYNSDKNKSDTISFVLSSETKKTNEYLIREVSKHNEILYPLLNLFHKNIQKDFNWNSYAIFSNWHERLLPLNLIFPLIVIFPFLILKKTKRIYKQLYLLALSSWLITLFFFTVNIGSWGLDLFLWFNKNIPGFVMFRNMFDKFAPAMAFSYAFLLGISIKIIFDQQNKNINTLLSLVLISTVLLVAKPFIFGEYYKNQLWTTTNTYTTLSDLNRDFYGLVTYISKMDTSSRFLWLPINTANYILIQDKKFSNHYYSGVSPLQFLTKKNDLDGLLSFPSKFSQSLIDNILKQKTDPVVHFFQQMNVKYIIVNNDVSDELKKSYLYTYSSRGDLYNAQNENLKKVILGRRIKDFGKRYSLYEINKSFSSEKIYLTEELNKLPNNFSQVIYKKRASYRYDIDIANLKGLKYLVFLDPHHKGWGLYFKSGKVLIPEPDHLVFDYANGWTIDSKYIRKNFPQEYYQENPDGSINLKLTLYFKPRDYFYPSIAVSIGTTIILLLYLTFKSISNQLQIIKKARIKLL